MDEQMDRWMDGTTDKMISIYQQLNKWGYNLAREWMNTRLNYANKSPL